MNFNQYANNGGLKRNPRMTFDPTFVPSSGKAGQASTPADDYISIEVNTDALSAPVKVVLFDGSQGYQLSNNYIMPSGVVITANSGAPYQLILNDLVHANLDIFRLQLRVFSTDSSISSEEIALSQFDAQMQLYEASKASPARLIKTINPGKGFHEMQQKGNVLTFNEELTLSHRHALVYMQQPNTRFVIGFYVRGEFGRTI